MKSDVNKLLKKHAQLNHLDAAKVISHVQRDSGDWVKNTLKLEGYDVPFKYSRKEKYRSLQGGQVNLTYYAQTENVAHSQLTHYRWTSSPDTCTEHSIK